MASTQVPDRRSTPLFTFDDVWVRDGDTVILRGITTTIAGDGITVVRGASGSGKSTLLRLCNRLVVPASGSITFRGSPLLDLDPVQLRRNVGMVFQRPTPFAGSVLDNLRAAAPMDREHATGWLARVGLDPELLDRDALTLSGGEAQRMCVARTLATGCSVVLADEITSALDAEAARVLEQLALDLAVAGTTIVWVTHDRAQCERIATYTLHLEGGRVVD